METVSLYLDNALSLLAKGFDCFVVRRLRVDGLARHIFKGRSSWALVRGHVPVHWIRLVSRGETCQGPISLALTEYSIMCLAVSSWRYKENKQGCLFAHLTTATFRRKRSSNCAFVARLRPVLQLAVLVYVMTSWFDKCYHLASMSTIACQWAWLGFTWLADPDLTHSPTWLI